MADTLHLLMLYALTDLMACLTPGPAVLAVTSHALGGSWRGAAGAIVGINIGNMVWFALVGGGLVALFQAAPMLFSLLRWGGIAYLVWMGVQSWRNAHAFSFSSGQGGAGFTRGLFSAIAVQLSNPKALLFFSVLVPPFLNLRAPIVPQIAMLAAIGVVIEAGSLLIYAWLAWTLGKVAIDKGAAHWIGRVSGVMLLGAAGALSLSGGQS